MDSAPLLPPAPQKLVIATRRSRLALWQAHHIQSQLHALYPDCRVELLSMSTQGDLIVDRPLSRIGGKGLFVKELEQTLLDGRADLAVHSMKDVPMVLPDGFMLSAICTRDCPNDALVSNRYDSLEDLPPGALVGTSSLRREAQLRAQYPHLAVSSLRGNLDTRLRKLDEGAYDAIILAAAGLKRLGLTARIRATLPVEQSLPAAGQGALGIEILALRSDMAAWLSPLHDAQTAACVEAERALSRALGGSCEVPLGAYAHWQADGVLNLRALVAHTDGRLVLHAHAQGVDPEELGAQAAAQLRTQGADAILAAMSGR
jgi:hydroxymethylbilane synthase